MGADHTFLICARIESCKVQTQRGRDGAITQYRFLFQSSHRLRHHRLRFPLLVKFDFCFLTSYLIDWWSLLYLHCFLQTRNTHHTRTCHRAKAIDKSNIREEQTTKCSIGYSFRPGTCQCQVCIYDIIVTGHVSQRQILQPRSVLRPPTVYDKYG